VTSPSATGISDSILWIERLIHAFGSPNWVYATELCNWHKDYARAYTFGVGVPAPDFAHTGCMLLWGQNPSTSWLTHAIGAAAAKARGTKLIVVDPRQAGLANKADLWVRVRPGTDGALALGVAGVMLDEGWYDHDFMRDWSNGPLLVHPQTGLFLTAADLSSRGDPRFLVAWNEASDRPVLYDPSIGAYEDSAARPMLLGVHVVDSKSGHLACPTALEKFHALCCAYSPGRVAEICWLAAEEVRTMARLLHESGPVCYYGWTGVGQHTDATQTDRAIALICALTGGFDAPEGNVIFDRVAINDVRGGELMPQEQRAKTIGIATRPLGPPRDGWVTGRDLYDAILTQKPYPVRGLVGFGANLIVSHADGVRAKEALSRLDFYIHTDLTMNPTAELADIVLPVASAWEREALRVGFEVSQEAEGLVQLRQPVVASRGETRPDSYIIFELAQRLGLGPQFWNGDIDPGYRHILAPSGISLETLRQHPEGVAVQLKTRYRKYAGDGTGAALGFATPTRKVEIYSQLFLKYGLPPLPDFVEPATGPLSRPDLVDRYPLVLTCAKATQFCQSQHRNLPRLRRQVPDPCVEIHPTTAAARAIAEGDWVAIETPHGRFHARARMRPSLDPRVAVGQHGWWQECRELNQPGYEVLGPTSANYNAAISSDAVDPVSGVPPHRSYLCEIRKL
jgi:anaerobic selenocysteine-containing dehydrogenase